MKISGTLLLLASLLALAPPAYPQKPPSQTDMLIDLNRDMLNLKDTFGRFEKTVASNNSQTAKFMEAVIDRLSTLNATVQKLGESVGGVKADVDRSAAQAAKDQQDLRTLLNTVKKSTDDLYQDLTSVRTQLNLFSRELTAVKTKADPLPTAGEIFSQVFADFQSAQYDLAASGFQEFLRQYPADSRAATAQLLIGDSRFNQKKFDQAEIDYDELLQKFPDSDRKCSASLRKGQAQAEQKKIPEARQTLTAVTKECAGTQEAANATASLKLLR